MQKPFNVRLFFRYEPSKNKDLCTLSNIDKIVNSLQVQDLLSKFLVMERVPVQCNFVRLKPNVI